MSDDDRNVHAIDPTIEKLLVRAKERGFITYDEINHALPPERVSSEEIEDTMALLIQLGIKVVEAD
jgi:RNA polymerase primary sigma factor